MKKNKKRLIVAASIMALYLGAGINEKEVVNEQPYVETLKVEDMYCLEDSKCDFEFEVINNILNEAFGTMVVYAAEPTQAHWKQMEDKSWRYVENGVYATGWRFVNNKWYFMNEQGVMLENTWISGLYYVGADGAMYTSSWTPDGYYVGADGAWIPNYKESTEVIKRNTVSKANGIEMDIDVNIEKEIKVEQKSTSTSVNTPKAKIELPPATSSSSQNFLKNMQTGKSQSYSNTSIDNIMSVKNN